MLLAIELEAQVILATTKALTIYDEFVERDIPWKELQNLLDELDKYRNDFSFEIASLIAGIRAHTVDGIDGYFYASQSMYEWLSSAELHMKLYVALFNDYNAEKAQKQKKFLLEVLDSGAKEIDVTVKHLDKSSKSFYEAGNNLTALRKRFGPQFYQENKEFQSQLDTNQDQLFLLDWVDDDVRSLMNKMAEIMRICNNLEEKLIQASFNIIYAEKVLLKQMQLISNLKRSYQDAALLDNMSDRDRTIKLAQLLVVKSEEFRKKHKNKT